MPNLPALTGSEKQIAYANDLRAAYLDRVANARRILAVHREHGPCLDDMGNGFGLDVNASLNAADATWAELMTRLLELHAEHLTTATTARAIIDGPFPSPELGSNNNPTCHQLVYVQEPADRLRMRRRMRQDPSHYAAARRGCPFHGEDITRCAC